MLRISQFSFQPLSKVVHNNWPRDIFLIVITTLKSLVSQDFQQCGELLCAWFATLVWNHHALRFKILCIFTKAPGATFKWNWVKI